MRLIFIRHGDPDYAHDSLTEKGWREANLLAERVKNWEVEQFYVSPLGRAKATAEPSLKALGRTAIEMPWLREYGSVLPVPGKVPDPSEHEKFMKQRKEEQELYEKGLGPRPRHIMWDNMEVENDSDLIHFDPFHWYESEFFEIFRDRADLWEELCTGIDGLLEQYGYRREHTYYRVDPALTDGDEDKNIVFFCHYGVTCALLGHLLNISPVSMWHGFFGAPTSVTILNAEKRFGDYAHFRTQVYGDTKHLAAGGEPISGSGNFAKVFDL